MTFFGLFYNPGCPPKFPEQNIDFAHQKPHFFHVGTLGVSRHDPHQKSGLFSRLSSAFRRFFGVKNRGFWDPLNTPISPGIPGTKHRFYPLENPREYPGTRPGLLDRSRTKIGGFFEVIIRFQQVFRDQNRDPRGPRKHTNFHTCLRNKTSILHPKITARDFRRHTWCERL